MSFLNLASDVMLFLFCPIVLNTLNNPDDFPRVKISLGRTTGAVTPCLEFISNRRDKYKKASVPSDSDSDCLFGADKTVCASQSVAVRDA